MNKPASSRRFSLSLPLILGITLGAGCAPTTESVPGSGSTGGAQAASGGRTMGMAGTGGQASGGSGTGGLPGTGGAGTGGLAATGGASG
ncbi:MAG: hypothetical protein H7X95_05590, partial [Deltaproteobacteria bacterium]|nr:hypothetical protein [Deltaproteobacteria bacterium]